MPRPFRNSSLPGAYFFTPRTASFAALATRNLTTALAGILIFCCVLGLKPVRAFLFCFTSLPKPGKTNSPFFLIDLYARSPSVSRNTPAILCWFRWQQQVQLEVQFWSCLAVAYGSGVAVFQDYCSSCFFTCSKT